MEYKNIKFGPNFVTTPIIEPVLQQIEVEAQKENIFLNVISGLRDANAQLRIIRDFLVKHKLDKKYPAALTCNVNDKATIDFMGKSTIVYVWQMAWSNLLNIGIIINPPIGAICLMDYINKSGENKKGKFIDASPHFKGGCFDIGGGNDGIGPETEFMKKLIGKVKGLVGILPERGNNCLHCDCKFIG